MRTTKWLMALGLVLMTCGACVGGSKGPTAEDKKRLAAYIVDSEPKDIPHKLDINFENKIRLIGYKAEPEVAKPGTEVKLTWYWRCDDVLDDGWGIFTHVVHDDGRNENLDSNGPLREAKDGKMVMGPSRWEHGKIYIDEQTYKVLDNVKSPEITFMLGIWKNDARLRIVSGPNDGDNRAIAAKLKTGVAMAPPQENHTEVPHVSLRKLAAGETITVDGKSDDKAWGGAPTLGPFVEVGTGKPNTLFPVNAVAKLAYDDHYLYVLAEVREDDVVGAWDEKNKKPNEWTVTGQPKCWTKDTVELMIEPDATGDNHDYYELQISPQNKVFHSQYDTERVPLTEPNGPFGHEEWDPKMKSAVTVKGKLLGGYEMVGKDAGAPGNGYVVEAAIPFASFNKPGQHPPQPGDVWRMNLYAMRRNAGIAWAPVMGGTFHHAAMFGRVSFLGDMPPMPPSMKGMPMGHARPQGMTPIPAQRAAP